MTDTRHAIDNARGWFETISTMVAALDGVEDDNGDVIRNIDGDFYDDEDAVRERIMESVLSVQVHSPWYSPGSTPGTPAEYEILLTTGGPALRITGDLSERFCEPETARLQYQDWGIPWTAAHMADILPDDMEPSEADEILLRFASVFYFGG